MTMDTSAFQRELDALEGNARAETKKELTRLSGVCKDAPDDIIARKLKRLLGSGVQRVDLASMVAVLKAGDRITIR